IALILALVLVNRPGSADDPTSSGQNAAKVRVDPGASRCALPGFEKTATLTEAPDAPWILLGEIGAPEVAGSGPGVVQPDGFRYCYAHTALGAVVAALNIMALDGDSKYEGQLKEFSTAPKPPVNSASPGLEGNGPPMDDYGSDVREEYPSWKPQFQGFRIINYTENTATLEVVMDSPRSISMNLKDLTVIPVQLEWHGGDWRIQSEVAGVNSSYQWESMDGFIPWNQCRVTTKLCVVP
ncbi:MAG: hypothetical protein ACRC0L_11260, partial [Angustibacter sp.]